MPSVRLRQQVRRAAQAVRAHPLTAEADQARLAGLRWAGRLRHSQGMREVSEAVIDVSDFVQFTGSSATGVKVMERAARRLTPVSLELGGRDPMIVLEDADIDLAAHAAVWGAMFNAGQTCVSGGTRIRVGQGVRPVRPGRSP